MKLLIDEMWEPELAEQLRLRGYDVVSVHERSDLEGRSDDLILRAALREGRAIVTENYPDFRTRMARALHDWGGHSGLVLTSNRRFPRHRRATLGRVVIALTALLDADPDLTNQEVWLE